ncbi:alpha/beta fold family hydrolase [Nitzschia inconspicua]|uniref:Alpha/beta fold family hydrolase n=1 Tax=Nitzschia inconspicua TaxID=303405 RepID=A0A9K3M6N7_9STRA|nr:alpha/beta fold family hydrolase [Nitzschia inconspicua]
MTASATKALLLAATQAANRKIFQKTKIPSMVSFNEIALQLHDGMTLAGQRWTYGKVNSNDNGKSTTLSPPHKILALHGWLDNSASFHYLAPHLVDKLGGQAELVALDLPGHGLSSHKSLDGPPTLLSDGVYYVAEALDKLGWTKARNESGITITLIGHSMGGGLSLMYAAAFPEYINKLVLLDIYSPLPGEHDKSTSLIRSHIEARQKGPRPNRVYKSLEQAIQTRQMTAAKAPGKQWLSLEAATELVTRATMPVTDEDGAEGFSFRHDTRLLWPSLQHLMPEQIDSMMKSVESPTCILAAEHGWPFKQERVNKAVEIIQPRVHKILPGSHHLHADPETAEAVLEEVYHFVAEKDLTYVL